jgi:hypothetical protein
MKIICTPRHSFHEKCKINTHGKWGDTVVPSACRRLHMIDSISKTTQRILIYLLNLWLYIDAASSAHYIASNDRMISEWIGKDVEGTGRGLIKGTIPAFGWSDWGRPRETQSGYPGFEPETSRIRSRIAYHSAATLGTDCFADCDYKSPWTVNILWLVSLTWWTWRQRFIDWRLDFCAI